MPNYKVKIAVRKTKKYAVSAGGDSVEVIERPKGGVSVVLADGQGSGLSAKKISGSVVNTVIGLIAEGVRDGAVARAAHDKLFAARHGKVSSTLVIATIDLHTKTLVVSRNGNCPVFIWDGNKDFTILDEDIPSIGFHYEMKPQIRELPLKEGLVLVAMSDGITAAGRKFGQERPLAAISGSIERALVAGKDAEEISTLLIEEAMNLDKMLPRDDMSVVVIQISKAGEELHIRKLDLEIPFEVERYV